MIYKNLNRSTIHHLQCQHPSLLAATKKYERTFHPISPLTSDHTSSKDQFVNTIRTVTLFIFTLGIYHCHVRRLASREWKSILCARASQPAQVIQNNIVQKPHASKLQEKLLEDRTKEVQKLQNEVNGLIQEREDLAAENARCEEEKDQLNQENQDLTAENARCEEEKDQLNQRNLELRKRLKEARLSKPSAENELNRCKQQLDQQQIQALKDQQIIRGKNEQIASLVSQVAALTDQLKKSTPPKPEDRTPPPEPSNPTPPKSPEPAKVTVPVDQTPSPEPSNPTPPKSPGPAYVTVPAVNHAHAETIRRSRNEQARIDEENRKKNFQAMLERVRILALQAKKEEKEMKSKELKDRMRELGGQLEVALAQLQALSPQNPSESDAIVIERIRESCVSIRQQLATLLLKNEQLIQNMQKKHAPRYAYR